MNVEPKSKAHLMPGTEYALYHLDLTNVREENLPAWWPPLTPRVIPLRHGTHDTDWDLAEELMPPGWRAAMFDRYPLREPSGLAVASTGKPVGLSTQHLQRLIDHGAVLRPVSGTEAAA